jgi:hypothetical protein
MRTILIHPDGLEADAVVPQCLDNQYVSDAVFSKMVAGDLDFTNPEIARLRESDFRTEFIRSLVYSSQVVIQRAYLKNSDFLYKNYLPKDAENFEAFGQLIRDKAVVPFLFKESSLEDQLSFDLRKEGDRALKDLLGLIDDVVCVRLAFDEEANRRKCDRMSGDFGEGLTHLAHMSREERSAMASELFLDRSRLQEVGQWEAFNKAVDSFARYAFEKNNELRAKDKFLQRTHVYSDHFVREGEKGVVHGLFKQPGRDSPFLLELKKYVDLVYNCNLPDHLKRYTFTPENLPSRMAMQKDPGGDFGHEEAKAVLSDQELQDSIRRTFMARSQRAMNLPLLRDLTVSDVREIRALPEWKDFADSQAKVLEHPKELRDRFDRFQRDFDKFQRALSNWYNYKSERPRTEKNYLSFVSLALNLAGHMITAGAHLGPIEHTVVGFAVERLVDVIPEKIKNYAVKLMVGVYDIGEDRLDADRSYSVELMQTNAELVREDVEELLRSINSRTESPLPPRLEQTADQGTL